MKTKFIAALLLSSAVISLPAFALGNVNLGNDVQDWEGPSVLTRAQVRDQLIASEKANQYVDGNDNLDYPVLANTAPEKTRAEVKQELAAAEAQDGHNVYDNTTYPAESEQAAVPVRSSQTTVAQGNGLPTRDNP